MKKYLKVVLLALSVFLLSACGSNGNNIISSIGSNNGSSSIGGSNDDSNSDNGNPSVDEGEVEVIKSVSISLVTSEDGTYSFQSETTPVVSNITYNWDFGGRVNQPSQSKAANPVISYIDEGDYTVSLTVEANGKAVTSDVINISYYQPVKVVVNSNDNDMFTGDNHYGGAVTDKKLYIWNDAIRDATHYDINNELIKDLAITMESYIVLTESGKIYTYGNNSNGTLGDGTTTSRKEFKVVEALNGVVIKKIYNALNSVFAIDDKGRIYSWGNNDKGILGIGSDEGYITTPTQITELNNIEALAVSYKTVLALDKDGKVYSWGANTYGQLGIDNTTTMKYPVKIEALADKVITGISIGGDNYFNYATAYAIDNEGKVYGWGSNDYNNIGLNITNNKVPNIIESLKDKFIVSVAQNYDYTAYALDGDGKVYSWGKGNNGVLGHGNMENLSEPKLIEYFSNNNIEVRKIAFGGRTESVYAIDTNGKMYSWGNDTCGQLGVDRNNDYYPYQTLPVKVNVLNDYKIVYVENGDCTTFAVSNKGKVFGAGSNWNGEFGMSSITSPLSLVFLEITTIPALEQ